MLSEERLSGLVPAVVIVQAGHDDVGVPAARETRQVRAAVDLIRSVTPKARIALITVFAAERRCRVHGAARPSTT